MKKKILLFEPGARYTLYPPIGLMHLAAVLREDYDVLIKDYSGEKVNEEEVRKTIGKINPFIVGVRVLTGPPIPRAIAISKVAKSLGKIVVWGGPHPTILPKQSLEEDYIDSVVIGEGEYTFKQLLKYYEGKKTKLDGVGIKTKKGIKINPASKYKINLDDLPLPAWDLLDNINKYFPDKKHNLLPISTTRGCAFKCGFCHNSNKNVKDYLGCYRIANPKRAIEEYRFVQSLIKNKIDILDVGEDLHLVSEDYAKRFCQEIKKTGLKWFTAARYQTLTKEIIDMISNAGCIRILLGIESGSERIQSLNNKIVKIDKAKKIAKYLRKKRIFVTNTYIFGHPSETEAELKKTLKFIKEIPADENLIQLYRPMPGTPYFQMCIDNEKIKSANNLADWAGFGVLGNDTNISEVPSKILFSSFYKTNALQQSRYWINQQRFFLRNKMHLKFVKNIFDNRFTFKLKEYINREK